MATEQKYLVCCSDKIRFTIGNIILAVGFMLLILMFLNQANGTLLNENTSLAIVFFSMTFLWACLISFFVINITAFRNALIQFMLICAALTCMYAAYTDRQTELTGSLAAAACVVLAAFGIVFLYFFEKFMRLFMKETFSKLFIVLLSFVIVIYILGFTSYKVGEAEGIFKFLVYLVLFINFYAIFVKISQIVNTTTHKEYLEEVKHLEEAIKQ